MDHAATFWTSGLLDGQMDGAMYIVCSVDGRDLDGHSHIPIVESACPYRPQYPSVIHPLSICTH